MSLVAASRPQALPLGPQVHQTGGERPQQGVLELVLVGLQAVAGLGGRQARERIVCAPGVAHIALQQKDRVLVWTLGR